MTAAAGAASEMRARREGDGPVVRRRGTDPQVGWWQRASQWIELAGTQTAVARSVAASLTATDGLPRAGLSAGT